MNLRDASSDVSESLVYFFTSTMGSCSFRAVKSELMTYSMLTVLASASPFSAKVLSLIFGLPILFHLIQAAWILNRQVKKIAAVRFSCVQIFIEFLVFRFWTVTCHVSRSGRFRASRFSIIGAESALHYRHKKIIVVCLQSCQTMFRMYYTQTRFSQCHFSASILETVAFWGVQGLIGFFVAGNNIFDYRPFRDVLSAYRWIVASKP